MTVTAEPLAPVLVSIAEAARLLGVSRVSVYALFDRGELPSCHIGSRHLVRYADLEALASIAGSRPVETPEPTGMASALAAMLGEASPAPRRGRPPLRRTDGRRRRVA
jgi:excisionase family DNA binding protein